MKTLSARTVLTKAAVIFMTILIAISMLPGSAKAYAETGPAKSPAIPQDIKLQIVGTPTVYVQSGNENIFSVQVKNISSTEVKGVNVCHGFPSMDDYYDENGGFVDGYSSQTTTQPGYEPETWYRFTTNFEKTDYAAVNAVWDSDEEGYTIGAGKTATLWFKVRSKFEEPGTYNEWIKFGDVHTELVGGFYPIPIVDKAFSGECAVKVVTYNPSGAAITHGTSENHGFDITPVAVGSTIDFGTVDLTKETGLTAEREYITRNTSTGYNGDITKDEHGQTSDITVDLDMEYSTSIDWRVGHPFTLDTNLSYGMHWSPLPAAPMSSNQFQSATTGVGLNATYFIAGTYTADLVLNTMPHGVKVNGSAIHTNGRYTWPVKVTLTGTNPRIPKAPVNVIADPGNGQVEITWNAAAGEETSQFEVYRREGTETATNKAKLNTAQFNWNDYEWVGNDTPDSEGNYLVVDGQVENGKTYTYVVIGGDPLKAYPAFAVRKGSTSTDVTPDSSYQSRLQKPDRFYGNEEQGGVRLEWEMNENYGGDSNDGSSMVDHFNIYRDGVLVMQVQQNAVIADPYYGWGPEPDDPDTYTYHLLSVEYGWECFVETPEIYQNYTWNVAAVSKSGVEGYWSDPDTRMGVNDDRVEITGHNATVNLDWDYPYWDDGDYDTKVEVLSVTVSPWFTDPHNAYIESVDYWRAEGTNAPDTTAAPYHTKVTEDYGNVETVLTDTNVTKGKTYTYTVHLTSSDGVESNYHTFTVKVPTGSNWYTADYSSSYVTWSTVNGRKAQLSWYADYEYDDYSDWHYIGTYKVYRNNTLIKTYTASGKEDGELLYTDDPGSDGTYVYRMDKVINGITIRGREFTFVRDTKPVDESTLLKVPGAPLLDIRVSDGNPILRWAAGNQGGAVEGYHIYRKDAGKLINGSYNSYGRWPNMRYITIDDPSVTSLTDIYGAFVEGDPSKGYLEGVAWSESVCPHEYWITAYNQAGESEPSQVISLSGDGEDEYGNPLPPANSDDYPPGTPDITKLWIDWDDESNYSTEWDSMVAGYIHVAWEDAPGTAASIDSWDLNVSGLKYNWPESLEAWKAEREPDAKLGTSDRYSPKIYIEGDPGDDGDLGRTASVTVTAKNSAGSTVSAPETILVTSFPQFRALPGNASAKLQWTDLYKDSETTVTAWEIRRKGEFTPWETVATISAGTLDYEKDKNGAYITDSRGKKNYTWTDTNIDNGWTYEYKVVAKCGDNIDRESVTREVAPVYSAALETPGAPRNLSYDIVNGEVIFTWDPPAEGTAQRYYVMYEYQRSYDDTPSWNWIADAFAPSTSAVWAPREAGSYRCFVYSRSYINGSDVPYMPYEGSFEEQYPTASNIITVTIDDDQIAQQADDYPGSFTLTAAGGENKITLNWTASEGATYYEINRRSSDDGTYFNTVTLPAGTTSYVDTSTIPGVRYQYDVTAKNSHGGVYNRVIAAATGKTKDQAAAESVAVLIDALPDPDDVTLDDADAITETKALYDGLTKKQQNLIDSELRQKLADDVEQLEILQLLEKYSAITDPVQALIDALPDAENVTLDDEADIAAARAAYDAVTPAEAKKLVKIKRLTDAEEALNDLKYNVTKYTSVEVTGRWMIGAEERPQIDVVMRGASMAEGTYSLSFVRTDAGGGEAAGTVTSPGTYRVVATGISPYFGQAESTATFKAYDVNDDLSRAVYTGSGEFAYTGEPVTPVFTVTVNGKTLTEGTDFVISGRWSDPESGEPVAISADDIVETGRYHVDIAPANGSYYLGSGSYSFSVVPPVSIEDAVITGIEDKVYNGAEQKQTLTVTYDGEPLVEGNDYTVTYSANKSAGTAHLTIAGAGKYVGKVEADFEIAKAPIDSAVVSGINDVTYTGSEFTPEPVVRFTLNGAAVTLTAGTDYTVSYADNINVGTATVTITGTGNFTGEIAVQFKINEKPAPTPPPVDPSTINGEDGTPIGKGASAQAAEKAIINAASDEGPAGSKYSVLQLKSTKQAKTSIKLTWKKAAGAKTYVLYGNKCGKGSKYAKLGTFTGKSATVKKVAGAKLKKGTYYKFILVALDSANKVVSTSKAVHAATVGGKVGNPAKITTKAKKNKVTVKVKKTFKLAAKQTGKKIKKHRAIKYETMNAKVATVSAKGVIKGVRKGTCYIYAYAQNGVAAKIKVTVK